MADINSLLIGVLVDVSGSMRESIGNSGSNAINRLEAFSSALENMIKRAADHAKRRQLSKTDIEICIFAYGFGFGNIISSFLGHAGPSVRDLFSDKSHSERTIDVVTLANDWGAHINRVRSAALEMFGSTPMKSALTLAKDRLKRELCERNSDSVLFILSDGEPSDGTIDEILAIADEIKASGTTIVSCFVTGIDITEPKQLYSDQQPDWPPAASLMFRCASKVTRGSSFEQQLREYDWRAAPGSHLFCQVNHSVALNEFLNLVLSPLASEDISIENKSDTNIVNYNTDSVDHIDARNSRTAEISSKSRLLFVHGLGGEPETTWGQFPSFLMADQRLAEKYAVGFFEYPTSIFRLPFMSRAPKIQELASGLRTQIEHDELEGVDLVCHSLGGLVARRYLIEEMKAKRKLRVRRLALLAVPNNGASLASIGKLVSWRQQQIKQMCKDADIIEFLNQDWLKLEIQNHVATKYIVGTQDEIVDRYSASGYWGNNDVETIVGKGHINISKPKKENDLIVKVVRKFLLDTSSDEIGIELGDKKLTNNDLRFILCMEDGENRLPEHFQDIADSRFGYKYEHDRPEPTARRRLERLLRLELVERVGGSEYRISEHGKHVLRGIRRDPGSYASVFSDIT